MADAHARLSPMAGADFSPVEADPTQQEAGGDLRRSEVIAAGDADEAGERMRAPSRTVPEQSIDTTARSETFVTEPAPLAATATDDLGELDGGPETVPTVVEAPAPTARPSSAVRIPIEEAAALRRGRVPASPLGTHGKEIARDVPTAGGRAPRQDGASHAPPRPALLQEPVGVDAIAAQRKAVVPAPPEAGRLRPASTAPAPQHQPLESAAASPAPATSRRSARGQELAEGASQHEGEQAGPPTHRAPTAWRPEPRLAQAPEPRASAMKQNDRAAGGHDVHIGHIDITVVSTDPAVDKPRVPAAPPVPTPSLASLHYLRRF